MILIYLIAMSKITNLIVWEFDMFNFQTIKPKWKIINCSSCCGFWLGVIVGSIFYINLFLLITLPLVISYISVIMEKKTRLF